MCWSTFSPFASVAKVWPAMPYKAPPWPLKGMLKKPVTFIPKRWPCRKDSDPKPILERPRVQVVGLAGPTNYDSGGQEAPTRGSNRGDPRAKDSGGAQHGKMDPTWPLARPQERPEIEH